jgi:hypothetical protein
MPSLLVISYPWLNRFLQSWELVAGAADLIDPSGQLVHLGLQQQQTLGKDRCPLSSHRDL